MTSPDGITWTISFNPRPPRRAGATYDVELFFEHSCVSILARPEGRALRRCRATCFWALHVSILARPEGRALRARQGRDYRSQHGFNPRPPRRAGATCRVFTFAEDCIVSILARPEGRALPGWRPQIPHAERVSILARPEGRALLTIDAAPFVSAVFQSSPAPKGGRYVKWIAACRRNACFNPRPPRRAGATLRCAFCGRPCPVSILARPEGRALQ